MIIKITEGWVKQEFDDNSKCVSQNFFAGDGVEYETPEGVIVLSPQKEDYQPFDMVQPGCLSVKKFDLLNQRERIQDNVVEILDGIDDEYIVDVCQMIVNRFKVFLGE